MKPLGTITMCFPHVDEETKSVLQSVMEEAENYADFTERLCEKACSEQVSPELQYFAFFHAFNMDMYPQMERLFNLDEDPILIEPLYLANRIVLGELIDMNVMNKALVKAMETIPNDWLACHLYLQWRRVTESFYPETDTDTRTMETLGERIKNDEDFECFKPLYIGLQAFGMLLKGYHSEAVPLFENGLSIARKHDDLPLVADGLYFLAETIKHEDESRAMDIMLKQKEIAEELGYAWAIARNLLVLGRIMMHRGEYDAALSHLLEFREVTESIGHPAAFSTFSLPFVYNLIRHGENALEYLVNTKGKIEGRKRHIAHFHLQLAFALMNIGDESEALTHLDTAKYLAVQSGIQGTLNMHQLLEGIFEKERGEFQSATDTLETLLKRLGEDSHLHKNLCFFHLADIEVETYLFEQVEISESWLHRFETYIEERNYPGFAAQAKILRAKLLRKQGKPEKSQSLVDEVLEIAKSQSMRYLKEMIDFYYPETSSLS